MLGFRMYSPGRGRCMAMWAVAAMAGSARQPPILGWASWNAYQCDRSQLTEANIRRVADVLVLVERFDIEPFPNFSAK